MGKQRVDVSGPSLTQQSAKDECDINLIVDRAKRGADLSQLSRGPGFYGDFTNLPSYRESLLMVKSAQDSFMSLDASVRKRFSNDPAELLDFLANPANRDEAVRLGLVNAPVAAVKPPVSSESPDSDESEPPRKGKAK